MNTMSYDHIKDPLVRAEAMRSQAIAQGIANLTDAIGSAFRAVTGKISKYMAYRRVYETLSDMTDRELDDIGLSRGDIDAVARGHDPRPKRDAYLETVLFQHSKLAERYQTEGKADGEEGVNDNRTVAAA